MSLLRKKVAQPTSSSSAIAANDQKSSIDTDFSAYGVIGGLLSIIKKHKDFMESQEKVVDNFVAKSQNPDVLRGAKKAALATEGELMDELMNDLGKLSVFLNDIILIENLFNSLFAAEQRQQQQQARKQHAPTISKHESKPKPTSQCHSFTELMLAGSVVYLPSFKKFISAVENECQAKHIRMVKSSGAQTKNIQRAFYKTFYVYAIQHGLQAHQQMTDVLRCSLVFDDFTELYRCFSVIETMAQNDPEISGGILRCKDRYNPESVPFGYRDLLVNLHCPGSAETIVCEIQLHHMLFYQHKKISHRMYKRARLFEDVDTDENLAYNHADTHTRKTIGDKVYEIQDDDQDAEQDDAPLYAKLLKVWGLEKFIDKFEEDGWTDILSWSNGDLSDDDLKDMGLKKGHIKTFKRNVNEKLNVAVAVPVADAQPGAPEPGAPEPQQVSPKTQQPAVSSSTAEQKTNASNSQWADGDDSWSWNANGAEPSLSGNHIKVIEFSAHDAAKYNSIVNGDFTLEASVTTAAPLTTGWQGFIGGARGQFWMGLTNGKWAVGIQYFNDFVHFGVYAKAGKRTAVRLIRSKNDWQLTIDDEQVANKYFTRSPCLKLPNVSIGAGFPNSKEKWKGEVHGIVLRRGVHLSTVVPSPVAVVPSPVAVVPSPAEQKTNASNSQWADDEDSWSWNANGAEPSLSGNHIKVIDLSAHDAAKYNSIVNGDFTLEASVTTAAPLNTAWQGFIGGARGQFCMGLEKAKWVVGIQLSATTNFVRFGVFAKSGKRTSVRLIRSKNDWQLTIDDEQVANKYCTRSPCLKLPNVSIGAGFPNSKEKWKGEVHGIVLRRGVHLSKVL